MKHIQHAHKLAASRSVAESVQKANNVPTSVAQRTQNNTGLPDNLKAGIQNLSGYRMDDVKVHYNSTKPAEVQAHACAQGTDVHLASGQERHLPHEAWHVVQQKQGRVKPTTQLKGKVNINDNQDLEHEADIMGQRALGTTENTVQAKTKKDIDRHTTANGAVVQRVIGNSAKIGDIVVSNSGSRWKITGVQAGLGGTTYTVQQISGRIALWNPRPVSSTDTMWNLEITEEPESEGYLSDDISSVSEGESVDLYRPSSEQTIRTKSQTPHSAERRSAKHIREMRGSGTKASKTGPFVTKFGDDYFEFHPTPFRKDYGVTPLVQNEDGSLQRIGGARLYPDVAHDLDQDIKRTGATVEEFNECLKFILRSNDQATLEELQKLCPKLDEQCLANLREIAAILRLDQGRASQAREVIDEEVLSSNHPFTTRFGKPNSTTVPTYRGAKAKARHGSGGVESLKNSSREKYDPKKKMRKETDEAKAVTYDIVTLSNHDLIVLINQAVERNARWALELTARTNGDSSEAIRHIREHHRRISVLPDGTVILHLQGG
jgi:hypothetical protein